MTALHHSLSLSPDALFAPFIQFWVGEPIIKSLWCEFEKFLSCSKLKEMLKSSHWLGSNLNGLGTNKTTFLMFKKNIFRSEMWSPDLYKGWIYWSVQFPRELCVRQSGNVPLQPGLHPLGQLQQALRLLRSVDRVRSSVSADLLRRPSHDPPLGRGSAQWIYSVEVPGCVFLSARIWESRWDIIEGGTTPMDLPSWRTTHPQQTSLLSPLHSILQGPELMCIISLLLSIDANVELSRFCEVLGCRIIAFYIIEYF